VLVRFRGRRQGGVDERSQAGRAGISRNETLFVSDVVCETVWVLLSAYEVPRAEVGAILGQLFKATHLGFRDVDGLVRALEGFVTGKGDFADRSIKEHARAAGCDEVATFDRAFLKEPRFAPP
jgi:predicted nucleic-acid-binding protein